MGDGRGRIADAHAVDQHEAVVGLHAADRDAAPAEADAGELHAGRALDGDSEILHRPLAQLLAGHDRHAGRRVLEKALARRGGDDDRLEDGRPRCDRLRKRRRRCDRCQQQHGHSLKHAAFEHGDPFP